MLVRPLILPDFWIELICPLRRASSKRLGLITVAVNLSPIRESLLETLSLMRTFKSVPTGTNGTTARRVVVRRFILGLVCEFVETEVANKARPTITAHTIVLMFIFIVPPQQCLSQNSKTKCPRLGHGGLLIFQISDPRSQTNL